MTMNEALIAEQRRERLSKAIDHLTQGDKSAFGRRLGFKDGAFIRQMLSGSRPISEKTIRHIENMPGMTGWFTQSEGSQPSTLALHPVINIASGHIASRYQAAPASVQQIVELVLRQPNEPVPAWATPSLLSIVSACLILAQDLEQKEK